MKNNYAIFKINNGSGALICSGCFELIKTRIEMTEQEKSAMDGKQKLLSQYCETCKNNK